MQRREFSTALMVVGFVGSAWAAPAVVSDTDFTKLGQAIPTEAGKIEVLEFFWYGCPHCFAFEPLLESWVKKLPSDVLFKRVPVAFNASFAIHQRLFYAIEALGMLGTTHLKVFQSIHVDKQRLDKENDVMAFVTKNGLDAKKFAEVFHSFSVAAKAKQAVRLAESYKIEGVPTLAVHGRYLTSGTQAGSPEHSLEVVDELIKRSRPGH
jgi:protein dithiol oxidoreductase (disulfide-forming)